MEFYDREHELEALEKEFLRSGSSFVVVYGRRRVGKTTLIQRFVEGKRAVYFLADTQPERVQVGRFAEICAGVLGDETLGDLTMETWDQVFRYLAGTMDRSSKTVIVIDEFQYLARVNNAVPSIFQRLWDEFLKPLPVMVILSGSLISMMYRHTLSYDSPLYGRRTAQMRLKPLRFRDFSLFFPDVGALERMELYAIVSGVPKYIELFAGNGSLMERISENVLDPNGFLYQEPMFILNEELTETTTYFSIMAAISAGEHKVGNIAKKLHIPTNHLTSFLQKLIELDLLERQVPVTEENPAKSKKGLYFIKDHFFRFWFRYVFPYRSYLEIGNREAVEQKIRDSLHEFVSLPFEAVMREYLLDHPPFDLTRIGRWWSKSEEIDIVAIGDSGILFGECKWSSRPIGTNILDNLKRKATLVPHANQTQYFALCSKSGFSDDIHTLAQSDPHLLLYDLQTLDI
jgi:AAA+ ATPase superfamily predicted ATPase